MSAFEDYNEKELVSLFMYYVETKHENIDLLIEYMNNHENSVLYSILLGDFYEKIDNEENMIKQYKKAADKNIRDAITKLIIYYGKKKDFDNMEKYIENFNNIVIDKFNKQREILEDNEEINEETKKEIDIIENKCKKEILSMMRYISNVYKKSEKYEEMEKKLKICVDNYNDVVSMSALGDYYRRTGKIDDMETYYIKGIMNECGYCAINYGMYFQELKQYEDMLKCYGAAIKFKNKQVYIQLYFYYKDIENEELKEKYYKLITEDKKLMEKYCYMNEDGDLFRK